MSGWKYRLQKGPYLRDAIKNGNKLDVLEKLCDCWSEIFNKMHNEDDKNEAEFAIDDIQDMIADYNEDGYVNEDVIREKLKEFYDFCDYARIWVNV